MGVMGSEFQTCSADIGKGRELKTESLSQLACTFFCARCGRRDATAQVPDDGAFPDEGFAEVTEGAEGVEEADEIELIQEVPMASISLMKMGLATGRVVPHQYCSGILWGCSSKDQG